MIKRRKLKGLSIVLVGVLALFVLAGCGGTKLSDDFREEEVKEKAEEVITLLNKKDSEAILEISTVQMKQGLTEEVFQQIYEALEEGGAFKEVEEMSVAGETDKETDQEFAVVVAKAQYENRSFVYTITFNPQMKLAGLFYK